MGASYQINNSNVIFFDGVCNLCNGAINFVIDRDNGYFNFSSLQSEYAQNSLPSGLVDQGLFSIILKTNEGKIFSKSRAVLEIARHLKGLWPILYVFIIIPPFIRNGIYNWVAKNRYKWFGKQDQCRLPTPELKNRFFETVENSSLVSV